MRITRVSDLLDLYRTRFRKTDVFGRKREGRWELCSSEDFVRFVNELSLGLLSLDIGKGDKVGIMAGNCPEWNFVDFGAMQIGAVTVPLYPNMSESDLEYILNDAGIKVLFTGDAEIYAKVERLLVKFPGISLFSFENAKDQRCWEDVRNMGKGKDPVAIESVREQVRPDDLLTLIYTSGTTGRPKGVMLSHRNIISNMLSCEGLFPPRLQKALSFLPLCHIFERMLCYLYLYKGIAIYYAESIERISDNLKEVQPDIFTAVPRLLEKVYDRILEKGSALKGVKRGLFYSSLQLGLQYDPWKMRSAWYKARLNIARRLVFSKWKAALGGNVKVIVSGGAALQPRLTSVFNAAGIPVVQGYGLTETSPVIAVNEPRRGKHKLGSVGRPVSGVEVRLAPDGEILCRGENIMQGYYKRPEVTQREIDAEGWFHTGDTGRLDEDGFLFITGRKKEIFKTAGGKYVSPPALENKFKESPFIEYLVVVGENRKFPAALIVPAFAFLREWCRRKEIPYSLNEEMVRHSQVIARYQQEMDAYNSNFGHWEQVKKFILLPKEWTIDGGELTPKLDVKRAVIQERFAKEIEALYAQ